MYFDVAYWWRVVRHVYGLRQWPGRRRLLLRLLIVVPLASAVHAVFFLLDYLFFPRLWLQQVTAPVFVIGHARSGTTLMHRLLSADRERFSYFLYWEMFFPSLLEKKLLRLCGWIDSHFLNDVCHRALVAWDDKTYGPYRHMHSMSLWNAEEDCFAMQAAFVTQQWSLEVPMMDVVDVFHVDDMGRRRQRWLHHYRELVKRQLLLNGHRKTHLAKNPIMSGWVDALIETFPDARFVILVRDPAECIPSCLKLVEATWRGKGWSREDYSASLRVLTDIAFEHFHHPRQVLERRPEVRRIAVDYRDLVAAPRETVHSVYAALGIPMSDDYDQWLLAQAQRERQHQSKFEYSLGDFEVSAQRIETELVDFYACYQWPTLAQREDRSND